MFFKWSQITLFWGNFEPPKICLRKDINFSHVCVQTVNGIQHDEYNVRGNVQVHTYRKSVFFSYKDIYLKDLHFYEELPTKKI